jgi:hypothetical protein
MAAWETAVSGYVIAAGELWAKSGPLPVAQPKQFVVTLDQPVEKVEEVAVESTAVPTQPPATPEATASQPAPNRTPLYIGLALVLVLLVGGWFYTQRRSQG